MEEDWNEDEDRVECPSCGEKFDECEIEGMGRCPHCGEFIT